MMAPLSGLQPPQVLSFPAFQAGSTSRSITRPAVVTQVDPVAHRAVVLDVGDPAGGVGLDVRRPVEVRAGGGQPRLAPGRRGRPTGPGGSPRARPGPPARSTRCDLAQHLVGVGDERQRAVRRWPPRRRSRRGTAALPAWAWTDRHADAGLVVDPPAVLEHAPGQVEAHRPERPGGAASGRRRRHRSRARGPGIRPRPRAGRGRPRPSPPGPTPSGRCRGTPRGRAGRRPPRRPTTTGTAATLVGPSTSTGTGHLRPAATLD